MKKTLLSFLNPALIALCVAGGLRQGAGLVLAYNIKSLVVDAFCDESVVGQYMSWIPLVGGTLGACLGGFVSDQLRKKSGRGARIWVLVASQVRGGGRGVKVCVTWLGGRGREDSCLGKMEVGEGVSNGLRVAKG